MSFAWAWSHIADVVWAAYGVSSPIGRYMDRRHGIPMGRVAMLEFRMLGHEHAEPVTRLVALSEGALSKRLSLAAHRRIGAGLVGLLRSVDEWKIPKSDDRSKARRQLLAIFEELRSRLDDLAVKEHGSEAQVCYYPAVER